MPSVKRPATVAAATSAMTASASLIRGAGQAPGNLRPSSTAREPGMARPPVVRRRPAVLITGGARRLGRALVRDFHAAGWDVLFTARHSFAEATQLAGELNESAARRQQLAEDPTLALGLTDPSELDAPGEPWHRWATDGAVRNVRGLPPQRCAVLRTRVETRPNAAMIARWVYAQLLPAQPRRQGGSGRVEVETGFDRWVEGVALDPSACAVSGLASEQAHGAARCGAELGSLAPLGLIPAGGETPAMVGLDLVVCSASSITRKRFSETTSDDLQSMWASNFTGPYFLTQQLLPMLRHASGSVVFVSDAQVERGLPEFSAYGAAKAALVSLTKTLAIELAPSVRVNAVLPGSLPWPQEPSSAARSSEVSQRRMEASGEMEMDLELGAGMSDAAVAADAQAAAQDLYGTPLIQQAHSAVTGLASRPAANELYPVEERDRILSEIPAGRLGTWGDVVQAIRYLQSSRFVSGQTLAVDGGRSARY